MQTDWEDTRTLNDIKAGAVRPLTMVGAAIVTAAGHQLLRTGWLGVTSEN